MSNKDIIISGKDYSNFVSKYGDLNIIRNVNGQEHLVNIVKNTNITIDNGTIEINYPLTWNTISQQIIKEQSNAERMFHSRLRLENAYIKGTCIAHIDEVIFNTKDITRQVDIEYTHNELNDYYFYDKLFYDNNKYYSDKLIYDEVRTYFETSKETRKTKETIPINNSKSIVSLLGIQISTVNLITTSEQIISEPRIISVDENSGTTISFDYKILIWSGYNTVDAGLGTTTAKMFLDNVNKITFSLNASTVEIVENDFQYVTENSQSFATDDPYELESNELMQYTVGQPQDEKISKITADKIFDGTNINRQIVSFDLLNVQKYDFDNGDGTKTRRYLTSRDKIKIKDENDDWVGEYNDDNGNVVVPYFEIIQIENVWDGSFYKRITAKQVL